MASRRDVIQSILFLKNKLSSDPLPEQSKIIKLLQKLSKLPVDVGVLQETGIGRCVNGLKKKCPGIAMFVKPLVISWKSVVKQAMIAEANEKKISTLANDEQMYDGDEDVEDEEGEDDGSDEKRESLHSRDEDGDIQPTSSNPSSPDSYPVAEEEEVIEEQHDNDYSSSGSESASPDVKHVTNESFDDDGELPKWSTKGKEYAAYVPRSERREAAAHNVRRTSYSSQDIPSKKTNISYINSSEIRDGRNKTKHAHQGEKSESKVAISFKPKIKEHVSNKSNTDNSLWSKDEHNPSSRQQVTTSELSKMAPGKGAQVKLFSNSLLDEKKPMVSGGKHSSAKSNIKNNVKSKDQQIRNSDGKPRKPFPKEQDPDDSLFSRALIDIPKVKKKVVKAQKSDCFPDRDNELTDNVRQIKSNLLGQDSFNTATVKRKSSKVLQEIRSKDKILKSSSNKNYALTKKSLNIHEEESSKKHIASHSKHKGSSNILLNGKVIEKVKHSEKRKAKPDSEKTVPEKSVKLDSQKKSAPGGQDDDDTFSNTGRSFGDCLFGMDVIPSNTIVKKSKPLIGGKDKGIVKALDKSQRSHHSTGKTKSLKTSSHQSVKAAKSPSSMGKPLDSQKKNSTERMGKKLVNSHQKRRIANEDGYSKKPAKKVREQSTEIKEASSSDVDLSLPDIQPNYKPLRLPEVFPSERRKAPNEGSIPLTSWFGSKQTKTKVYSGKARKRYYDHLPSLQDICKEVIFDNIDALYDVGGVPFYILEDVLEKCSPQQLLKIEDYNPDYILESDHLWKKHANKVYKNCQLQDMENWRDLYLRKNDERKYKLLAITAKVSASFAKKDTGRITKLAFVDKPVKPPRNVIRQQNRYGTNDASTPAKAPKPRSVVPGEPSSNRIIPSIDPVSPVRHRRPTKLKAPMMQKSLKLMKKITTRR